MTKLVIVAFRPKAGMEKRLVELVLGHAPKLRELGLATERSPAIMRNAEGIIVEVFEWADGGIERAHSHPQVLAMWGEFEQACDYVPLNQLGEAADMFAEFEPI